MFNFKSIFITILYTRWRLINVDFIGCEDFISQTKWDCNTYKYYFQERNLMHTLHCLAYDQDTLPNAQVNVKLTRNIKKVLKIDDNDENSLTLEENIRIEFIDPRLNFNDCQNEFRYSSEVSKYLWKPEFETFDGSSFNPKFEIAKLSKNGGLIFQVDPNQVTKIRCSMQFGWYPFDVQICTHNLIMNESPENVVVEYNLEKSLQNTHPDPNFDVKLNEGTCDEEAGKQCFPLEIVLTRKTGNHLLHVFLPTFMLAAASIMSLFIPPENMAPRMSLSTSTCLSMIVLCVGAK